jgi:dTDP-glucose 4,6-dehydratase
MRILICGGCGFIGTNLISDLIRDKSLQIFNIDKLSYASNINANKEFQKNSNYFFKKTDIKNLEFIKKIIFEFQPDLLINFAAESHVDNSIKSPNDFIYSNIFGTFSLLEAFRAYINKNKGKPRFFQISTDEVFGDIINQKRKSLEIDRYVPSSPYSSSKASADLLVKSWNRTYKLPFVITHTCNNFGPFQNKEKLIPKVIENCREKKLIPVYAKGNQIREWIYVKDNVEAIKKLIFEESVINEVFNIGSNFSIRNIDLIHLICDYFSQNIDSNYNYKNLIKHTEDRPGHDLKYSLNSNKFRTIFNWKPKSTFKKSLYSTIDWYLNNLLIKNKKT